MQNEDQQGKTTSELDIASFDIVSLQSLLLRLWNRRYWAVFVFVLSVAISAGYLSVAKPWYESRLIMQIGQVASIGPVEEPEKFVNRFKEKYLVDNIGTNRKRYIDIYPDRGNVTEVSVPKEGPKSFVTMILGSNDADKTKRFFEFVSKDVIRDQASKFNSMLATQTQYLEGLQQDLKTLNAQIKTINSTPNDHSFGGSLTSMASRINYPTLLTHKTNLKELISKYKLHALASQTFPTKILSDVEVITKVKPRVALIIALGILVGIFGGLLTALLADFIGTFRKALARAEK